MDPVVSKVYAKWALENYPAPPAAGTVAPPRSIALPYNSCDRLAATGDTMTLQTFETINPATGDRLHRYRAMGPRELDAALDEGIAAQRSWQALSVGRRVGPLRELGRLLRDRQSAYAHLMALEMGKVINEGEAEIGKCAATCDWFAEHAAAMLAEESVVTEAVRSGIDYRPLGLVLAVMPWNFPFWQVFRAAIPALAAGNGLLLKHAPNVLGCAAEIETLFREAGFPVGLCRSLIIDVPHIADVIRDRRIAAVTLTGSVAAGRAVAAEAGSALKKCVMELGGSDPFIVLDDADLDHAVPAAIVSRFQNCGQSCIAAKRFILLDAIRAAFLDRFIEEVRQLQTGDPLDPASRLGPMARRDLRGQLHAQVQRSIGQGARCRFGGTLPAGPGWYYPPTVLDRVPEDCAAWREELFGPVATVISVPTEAMAIHLANATPYGLAASVWTSDLERGERVGRTIESGMCFVNHIPASDPRLPFGGIKQSGFGRELSRFGFYEFVNIHTVWIDRM